MDAAGNGVEVGVGVATSGTRCVEVAVGVDWTTPGAALEPTGGTVAVGDGGGATAVGVPVGGAVGGVVGTAVGAGVLGSGADVGAVVGGVTTVVAVAVAAALVAVAFAAVVVG